MQIRAILIDDEKKGRDSLKFLLAEYAPEIHVQGEAGDIVKAYDLINDLRPDAVFLDVEMPKGDAFDLLVKFSKIDFSVIFTTAFSNYTLQAIKYSALDYLLKPIDKDDLLNAIAKLKQKKGNEDINAMMQNLLSNTRMGNTVKKIAIPDMKGMSFVPVDSIVHCESDQSYTIVYLKDRGKIVSTRHLKEYELLLEQAGFFRVHNSHLVNLGQIVRYIKGEGGAVVMSDGTEIEVSRRRKASLIEELSRVQNLSFH